MPGLVPGIQGVSLLRLWQQMASILLMGMQEERKIRSHVHGIRFWPEFGIMHDRMRFWLWVAGTSPAMTNNN